MATDLPTDARDKLLRTLAEREDYALRGAWRAGYDYVHVYRPDELHPLARQDLGERFVVHPDILEPSDDRTPSGRPGARYRFTYDLTSVPDEAIREAVRRGVS